MCQQKRNTIRLYRRNAIAAQLHIFNDICMCVYIQIYLCASEFYLYKRYIKTSSSSSSTRNLRHNYYKPIMLFQFLRITHAPQPTNRSPNRSGGQILVARKLCSTYRKEHVYILRAHLRWLSACRARALALSRRAGIFIFFFLQTKNIRCVCVCSAKVAKLKQNKHSQKSIRARNCCDARVPPQRTMKPQRVLFSCCCCCTCNTIQHTLAE